MTEKLNLLATSHSIRCAEEPNTPDRRCPGCRPGSFRQQRVRGIRRDTSVVPCQVLLVCLPELAPAGITPARLTCASIYRRRKVPSLVATSSSSTSLLFEVTVVRSVDSSLHSSSIHWGIRIFI